MKSFRIKKILSTISLLLVPTIVCAENESNVFPVGFALGIEAFVSLHMSFFVLKPLADMFSKENSKKLFWTLFAIRAVILIFCDFFVTPFIVIVDFIGFFIGVAIVVPICAAITKTPIYGRSNQVKKNTSTIPATSSQNQVKGIELKCAKCGAVLKLTDKACSVCGEPFDGNNVVVSENANAVVQAPPKVAVLPSNFDPMYVLTEDKMLEEFINRELTKAGISKSSKLIPSDILKRKKVLNVIFSILIFIFITLIFFHFPIYTYIIGLVILFIFFKVTRKYNLIKYLKKQLKARPQEKVSNIVMNVKNTFASDNSKGIFAISILIAILLPLLIFLSPRIIYEKVDDGYAVRYYIYGLTNFKTATIPETYKNKKVVSLRGNTFSNMPFLESVSLPDSITEIRGQAFKNCYKLTSVNMPKKLEYLGGGAFYNAKSLKSIEFPDTLTYLGGESFFRANSLEYVKLSNNLLEIRGDSFKYCKSLRSITIPDSVTRIGGHAFYGDSSLSEVLISENSKLMEIGSSAFRLCSSLHTITIPSGTYVNERAFKESPTVVNRFGVNNAEYILKEVSGNASIINLNEIIKFTDYNISVYIDSYDYFSQYSSKGRLKINFNDGVSEDVNYDFIGSSSSDKSISFTYYGYLFHIVEFQADHVTLTVEKITDYGLNYKYSVNLGVINEGDSYNLPHSNYSIKLEQIDINNVFYYDYNFSCNNEYFENRINNRNLNETNCGDNIKIQLYSFYGDDGILLNVYYN